MNNFFIKSFFFILLNIGIVLKSENIEFILTSSDTLKGFEFMKIEQDNIILKSSFSNYILNIKDLSSIDRLSSKIIKGLALSAFNWATHHSLSGFVHITM